MGLFGPAWKTSNWRSARAIEKAHAAVDKADDTELKRIALEAPLPAVAMHACERLKGSNAELAEIARKTKEDGVRSEAIACIDDPQVLDELVRASRVLAQEAIENPRVTSASLLWIAINSWPMIKVGEEAEKKLVERFPRMSKSELIELLRDDADETFRSHWSNMHRNVDRALWDRLGMLMSDGELADLVRSVPHAILREREWNRAAGKLSLEELLAFARNESFRFHTEAGKQLGERLDEEQLAVFAKEHGLEGGPSICKVVGHKLGPHCACLRCGKRIVHRFDTDYSRREGSVCTLCGGRVTTFEVKRNPFNDESYEIFTIEYPDGMSESWTEDDDVPGGWVINWRC